MTSQAFVEGFEMISRDLGNGFRAVPQDAVTLNGMALEQLNTRDEPYDGYWHIIAPNGKAIDGENGRPYLYKDIAEAQGDADRLASRDGYSTC